MGNEAKEEKKKFKQYCNNQLLCRPFSSWAVFVLIS